ncbi:hypothetical protein PoB_006606300 [Plakobranchus ocellatus]|uniref:Mutator-like transposase domain-containing protein n=1 Tax=Plakobranchus ocellatus TaxID=259542 RepID=A0AAV4D5Y9_9GAST|nr:hypothetical protein PoB_006606300 [Plakobranchus ocellatus]
MARNLRYTTVISDGDSKTHNELLRLDRYTGIEVVKEECTNHVTKCFGTSCRNLVAAESKKGNTLGGRKVGALTQQKIGLLQAHYKRAVASKCTSTAELRKKILRTLKHCSSSDDNPQHDDCPTGKDSWCFHQRAIAYGRPPSSHQGKSSCYLNPKVAEAVKPLYERLTTEALQSRCLKGMTQNANESLHSQVWQRCPKHLFAGRKRIEVATFSAVASFNCGSAGLQHFITAAGCSLNCHTITRGYKRDSRQVTQAESFNMAAM